MDQVASMFHPENYFREELSIGTKRLKSCVGKKEGKKKRQETKYFARIVAMFRASALEH